MQTNRIIIIVVTVLLLGGVGYYIFTDSTGKTPAQTGNNTDQTIQPVLVDEEGNPLNPDEYDIELVSSGDANVTLPSMPIPDLDRPITFPKGYPKDAELIVRQNIGKTLEVLRSNPRDYGSWLDLGIFRKGIEDYEGARLAWEYAEALKPEGMTAIYNLGDLNFYYLKNYPKAETYLLQAIKISPEYLPAYRTLHELYRYAYKQDSDRAVEILKQGIQAINNPLDLIVALASYYKSTGDKPNAIKYYDQAIAIAGEVGREDLKEMLEKEKASL